MEPPATRKGFYPCMLTGFGFHRPSTRRVLVQAKMGSILVVIAKVFLDQPSGVGLVEHDDVIKEFAAQGAVQPLAGTVLPGGVIGGEFGVDAHGLHECLYGTEDGVPIEDEVFRGFLEGKGFAKLLLHPRCGRVGGDVQMAYDPSPVVEDHEEVERAEVPGWNHQEIHGRDHLAMVFEEAPPALATFHPILARGPSLRHVAQHGAFADREAELTQFPVNPWRAPG